MSDLPLVRRVEVDGGHYYLDDQNNRIPGVTTILKNLPKGALEEWRVRQAVELALDPTKHPKKRVLEGRELVDWCAGAGDRVARQAANLGNVAHAVAESELLGKPFDLSEEKNPKILKMVECFRQFVRDWEPVPVLVDGVPFVELLVTYINPKTGRPEYCGTSDFCCTVLDGTVVLGDWKGQSKAPRSSHALQAAAYAHATHVVIDPEKGTLAPMPKVDRAAVVLLNGGDEDTCYRAFELDISKPVFSIFQSLLRIHRFCEIQDMTIMGPFNEVVS